MNTTGNIDNTAQLLRAQKIAADQLIEKLKFASAEFDKTLRYVLEKYDALQEKRWREKGEIECYYPE